MIPRVLVAIGVDTARDDPSGPRRDLTVLARLLGASVIDRRDIVRSPVARALHRLFGVGPALAWLARWRAGSVDVIVTDGEHSGIPLALLLLLSRSQVKHVTIGHRLSSRKKRPFFTVLRAGARIDRIVLHARAQERYAREALRIAPERLRVLPYQVDVDFWRPRPEVPEERLVVSAGLEHRDYETLIAAARGMDARFVIGAASHWSRHAFSADEPPTNVELGAFDYRALRELYRRAALVVVPLHDVDNQAGVTTILEAMSMGKAVIVTQSVGQTDVVEDRRRESRGRPRPASLLRSFASAGDFALRPNGFYVSPGNVVELRAAITYLLDNPDERARLGRAGREAVVRLCGVNDFAHRMRGVIADVFADTLAHRAPVTRSVEGADA
jgi:glycosyltransferase involved in cell wall biosynthesis